MNKAIPAHHPSIEELSDFLSGRLAGPKQAEIERHVATCKDCCLAMEQIPGDTLIEQMRSADTPNTHRPIPLSTRTSEIPPELCAHPRYHIIKQIGAGGMGVVFHARHRRMERPVALKVIHRDLLDHPTALERFQFEVKAAAQLAHPNIVTAHDADQAGELHFLVMEYVDGVSLAHLVETKGSLPVAKACEYIRQAALGLQHAFEHGMVHRDIKPQNLMLTSKGQIKILDFGLARFAREQDAKRKTVLGGGPRPIGAGLTMDGSILGTPDYIAPEQALDSREVDIRADIYSLGCTLYFLLKGEPPFATGSHYDKLRKHAQEAPPTLADARYGIPTSLSAIAEKMMAKNPKARYQTPAEVTAALASFANGKANDAESTVGKSSVPSPKEPRKSLNPIAPIVIGVGILVMLFMLGGGGLLGWTALSALVGWHDEKAINREMHRENERLARDVFIAQDAARKPVLVVLAQEFQHQSYVPLREALDQARRPVKIVSSVRSPCKPIDKNHPLRVTPDVVLPEDPIAAADYAAVIIPGGYLSHFKEEQRPQAAALWKFLKEMDAAKKPIAAIDSGLMILSASGTLKGRSVSENAQIAGVFPGGAKWTPLPIVHDGTLLTAGSAKDVSVFAQQIVNALP